MSVVQFASRQAKGQGNLVKSSIIAALDIGTTKISCLIADARGAKARGVADPREQMRVIGHGQTASRGVRAGAVVDINEAECAIRVAVDAAERMAQTSISNVTVSFAGGRAASQCYSGKAKVQTGVVGPRDLDTAISQAMLKVQAGKKTILHLSPISHALDGVTDIDTPLGLHGHELQADVGVTTVETAQLRNVTAAVERAHLNPVQVILAPYAAARSVLQSDETKLGALVIDLGGAVTSIAYLRNGKLIAADAVMVGGQHVTNDVARGLSTPIAHAERMKTLFGNALSGGHGEREMLAVPLVGERGPDSVQKIPKHHLTSILQARLEEIFEMVHAKLATDMFASSGSARVVLTGGASQIPGLRELAAAILQRPVRLGEAAALSGLPEFMRQAGLAAATGALLHAAMPDRHYHVPAEAQAQLQRASMGYARRLGHWLAEAL